MPMSSYTDMGDLEGVALAEIIPGLFLGSLRSLGFIERLQITHVLSVLNFSLTTDLLDGAKHLRVPLADQEDANLLQHLPASYAFIDGALKEGGRVLVHCQVGASRSPSVVLAYLMRNRNRSLAEASQLLALRYEHACINEGFLAQLGLFQDMKCSLDLDHPVYRVFCHEQVGRRWEESGWVDPDTFAVLPALGSPEAQGQALYRCRKCRQLLLTSRNIIPIEQAIGHRLFRDHYRLIKHQQHHHNMQAPLSDSADAEPSAESAVPSLPMSQQQQQQQPASNSHGKSIGSVTRGSTGDPNSLAARTSAAAGASKHTPAAAAASGSGSKAGERPVQLSTRPLDSKGSTFLAGHNSTLGSSTTAEPSLFVEPMGWMADMVLGEVQGKLYCPNVKCKARLGSFNWSGITNTHGAWVTPAFQLHVNKVDVVQAAPSGTGSRLTGIRQPVGGISPSAAGRTPVAKPPPASATTTTSAGVATAGTDMAAHSDISAPVSAAESAAGSTPSTVSAAACEAASASAPAQMPKAEDTPAAPREWHDLSAAAAALVGTADAAATAASALDGLTLSVPNKAAAVVGRCTGSQASGAATAAEVSVSSPAASQLPPDSGTTSGSWFTHLIFDCDGVLVDSERASCEALAQAIFQVTGYQIPNAFPVDFEDIFGSDIRYSMLHYKTKFAREEWTDLIALSQQVLEAKEVLYKQLTAGGIKAFDGVERLIQRARVAGMTIGVASGGAPAKIQHSLSSSGLKSHFSDPHVIVSACEVAAGKPAPDVYLEVLSRAGCSDRRRALVIEDAVLGLTAAKAAGAFAVGITNSLPAAVLAPVADLVVQHLDELSDQWLRQLLCPRQA